MTQLDVGSRNPAKLIAMFKQGLATDLFSKVAETIGVSEGQLAGRTGIPVSTLTRRKRSGKLSQHESERLYRVIHVFNRAVEVLGSDMAAKNWITNPVKALDWSTPLAYLETEIGTKEVEAVLGRIEHGVFS